MIRFNNITFKYENNEILEKITFDIDEGNFVILFGENGSGKSTLAKIISGIYKPTSGSYFYNGENINTSLKAEELRQDVGIIFQNIDDQFVYRTVERELAFSLENKNTPYKQMFEKVNQARDEYSISDLMKKTISKLSGGEKQKIALATFWIDSKNILIFDESSTMLDKDNLMIFWEMLHDLKKNGKTVIFITHSFDLDYSLDWNFLQIENKNILSFDSAKKFIINNFKIIYDDKLREIFSFQIENNFNITTNPSEIAKQIKKIMTEGDK